jgi:hypothetical protein
MLAVAAAELRLVELGLKTPDDVLRRGPLTQTGANRLTRPIRGFLQRVARRLSALDRARAGKGGRQTKKPAMPADAIRDLDNETRKLSRANDNELKYRALLDRVKGKKIGETPEGKDIFNKNSVTEDELAAQKEKFGTSEGELRKMRDILVDLLLAEGALTTEQHKKKQVDDLIEGLDGLFGDRDFLSNIFRLNK